MLQVALLATLQAAQAGAAPASPPAATTTPMPRLPITPETQTGWPFPFTFLDYPAAALRAHEEGTVRYRIEISPEGRVARCTILRSSGYLRLDEETCRKVSRRARFVPARDSEGNPVPDARDGEVTWRLEGED